METRSDMDIMVPEEYKPLWVQNEDRPVVKYPAEVLRQPAKQVDRVTKATRALIDRMKSVMKRANGIGIAAPQLGVSQRVCLIVDGKKVIALVNPVIKRAQGTVVAEEGCLSLPGLYGDVARNAMVEVDALDEDGRRLKLRLEGLAARCAQHEIDHLDGVLFIDRVDMATIHWDWPASAEVPK
jgi:peptide deformylase